MKAKWIIALLNSINIDFYIEINKINYIYKENIDMINSHILSYHGFDIKIVDPNTDDDVFDQYLLIQFVKNYDNNSYDLFNSYGYHMSHFSIIYALRINRIDIHINAQYVYNINSNKENLKEYVQDIIDSNVSNQIYPYLSNGKLDSNYITYDYNYMIDNDISFMFSSISIIFYDENTYTIIHEKYDAIELSPYSKMKINEFQLLMKI